MDAKRARYTAEQFIEAIQGTGRFAKFGANGAPLHTGCMGIINTVSKRVGCTWHIAKKYCSFETTPFVTVAQAFEDESQSSLDFTESQMFKQIQSGDGPMIRYHLSTKGKDRGYTERREVAGPGGGPIQTQEQPVDFSKLTDDELDAYIVVCEKLRGR